MPRTPKHLPGGIAVNTASRLPFLAVTFAQSLGTLGFAFLSYAGFASGHPVAGTVFGGVALVGAVFAGLLVRWGA